MTKLTLTNFLNRVELKSKIKFNTVTGFSLHGAEKGEMVKIGFQFNIDNMLNMNPNMLSQHMLDDFVYPEIMDRIARNKLEPTYRPTKAQILLNTNPTKNKVLLEHEVHFCVNCILKNQKIVKKNENIAFDRIQKITKIFPRPNFMPNSAHIMLLKFNSEWLIAMDLIYEKNKINSKMNSARDYLDSAQTNFTKNNGHHSLQAFGRQMNYLHYRYCSCIIKDRFHYDSNITKQDSAFIHCVQRADCPLNLAIIMMTYIGVRNRGATVREYLATILLRKA